MYEKLNALMEARIILREDAKELIQAVMSKRGIGQAELADELGVGRHHLANVKRGYSDMSLKLAVKLAGAMVAKET